LLQIFRAAIHIGAAVDQQKIVLAVRQQWGERGAVDAFDASQSEHTACQNRARGTRGYKRIYLPVAQFQHSVYNRAVLLFSYSHHGGLVIGDDFRAIGYDQACFQRGSISKDAIHFRLHGCGGAAQFQRKFRVQGQRFPRAADGRLRRVVAAHCVQINFHGCTLLLL